MQTYLVGYGTLLHTGSLGRSIGHRAAHKKAIVPVVIRGYRRLFNLRPTHYESSFKLSNRGNENGAANVEVAPDHCFNALGFSVDSTELATLDTRERYYRRVQVLLRQFGSDVAIGQGYIYSASAGSPYVKHSTRDLMPLWRDVVWARTGAYRVSEAFGNMFDETTYLADGKTLVRDHYRDVLNETSDVESPECQE